MKAYEKWFSCLQSASTRYFNVTGQKINFLLFLRETFKRTEVRNVKFRRVCPLRVFYKVTSFRAFELRTGVSKRDFSSPVLLKLLWIYVWILSTRNMFQINFPFCIRTLNKNFNNKINRSASGKNRKSFRVFVARQVYLNLNPWTRVWEFWKRLINKRVN